MESLCVNQSVYGCLLAKLSIEHVEWQLLQLTQ